MYSLLWVMLTEVPTHYASKAIKKLVTILSYSSNWIGGVYRHFNASQGVIDDCSVDSDSLFASNFVSMKVLMFSSERAVTLSASSLILSKSLIKNRFLRRVRSILAFYGSG